MSSPYFGKTKITILLHKYPTEVWNEERRATIPQSGSRPAPRRHGTFHARFLARSSLPTTATFATTGIRRGRVIRPIGSPDTTDRTRLSLSIDTTLCEACHGGDCERAARCSCRATLARAWPAVIMTRSAGLRTVSGPWVAARWTQLRLLPQEMTRGQIPIPFARRCRPWVHGARRRQAPFPARTGMPCAAVLATRPDRRVSAGPWPLKPRQQVGRHAPFSRWKSPARYRAARRRP